MADVIDALSFERTPLGRRYINYRDLGVQQLGSIYERLLEREVVREDGNIIVRPNVFTRKDSGSYYTPDDLVDLIVREVVGPPVDSRMDAFAAEASDLASRQVPEDRRMGRLKRIDPAERTLELKVCDPAMGSGHFLVNLVDYLADRAIEAMAEAEALVEGYLSPLAEQIDPPHGAQALRLRRGQEPDGGGTGQGFAVASHLYRLGTAQLSGSPPAVRRQSVRHLGAARRREDGGEEQPVPEGTARARHARGGADADHRGWLTDAEIAEAHRSADIFAEVAEMTALNTFMSFLHAFD